MMKVRLTREKRSATKLVKKKAEKKAPGKQKPGKQKLDLHKPDKKTPGKKIKKGRLLMYWIIGILILAIAGTGAVLYLDGRVENTGKAHVYAMDQLGSGYDCVIVPGALVYQNSTPSGMLQDRLDVALQIYEKGIVPKILVSGDHGTKNYDEVNVMRNYLIEKGVPAEDIFMDHAGFDTYQTIYRARDVFQVKKAVIATQDFHLYRALYIGEKLSLELDGVESTLRTYGTSSLKSRIREYFARVKAFIECEITKPEPEFLGPAIPITGDGKQTLD